eukprot:2601158-Rhodomonas_salina.1
MGGRSRGKTLFAVLELALQDKFTVQPDLVSRLRPDCRSKLTAPPYKLPVQQLDPTVQSSRVGYTRICPATNGSMTQVKTAWEWLWAWLGATFTQYGNAACTEIASVDPYALIPMSLRVRYSIGVWCYQSIEEAGTEQTAISQ